MFVFRTLWSPRAWEVVTGVVTSGRWIPGWIPAHLLSLGCRCFFWCPCDNPPTTPGDDVTQKPHPKTQFVTLSSPPCLKRFSVFYNESYRKCATGLGVKNSHPKDKGRRSALNFSPAHLSSWCRPGWFNAVAEPDSMPHVGTPSLSAR
jgi:hypothetical protein